MGHTNLFLSSKAIEVAEHEDYLELLNRVCYYDAPNLNDALLPYDDNAETLAQTLVEMPLVAKYTVDAAGKPTFKGHEVTIDEDGDVVFGTVPIGVHTEVYIQDDLVELPDKSTQSLPCLFAKMKVWKRNKNAIAAIRRLYAESNLHNSWELSVSAYEYSGGIKRITGYSFIGNALIGVAPAYGKSAEVLSVAARANELLVAEALSQDLIEAGEQTVGNEVQKLGDEKIMDTSVAEIHTEDVATDAEETSVDGAENAAVEQPETAEPVAPESAALTMRDLRWKIEEALYKFADRCLDVVFIFPESHTGWAHDWVENETDIYEFEYSVENDEVLIASVTAVALMVSPRNINASLDEKNTALIEAQKAINDLQAQVDALSPFKEVAEQAAREKAEAEHNAAVAQLRGYAAESGMVTSDELEQGEIAEMIGALDIAGVKSLISDRIVARNKKTAETASVNRQPKPRVDISAPDAQSDSASLLKKFIHS